MLIYQAGYSLKERRITWFDCTGNELSAGEKGSYEMLRLSPDGTKLAFKAGETTTDIWVDELARGVPMRLTNDPGNYTSPTWLPDGSRILFAARDISWQVIYQMNSNGAGGKEPLLAMETSAGNGPRVGLQMPGSSSTCARITPLDALTQDVWVLPLAGDRKPRLFVHNAYDGQFSPDGRWVAYGSHGTGTGSGLTLCRSMPLRF